jgi:hypothetical protein
MIFVTHGHGMIEVLMSMRWRVKRRKLLGMIWSNNHGECHRRAHGTLGRRR